MRRPKVLLTHGPAARANYFGPRALAGLESLADVRVNPSEAPWTTEALAAAALGCDIVVADRRTECPAALIEQLPGVAALCRCAVDVRNIDIAAASAQGILVTHASPGFQASVSEWVLGMMVDLARGISESVLKYRQGQSPAPVMGRELRGATLGLVGYGEIGHTLADIALALNMRVLVCDPYARVPERLPSLPLEALLAQADHVVCLASASAETENLFDAAAFAAMKPGAFFINASRGNLVDETALLHALDSGRLAGCALDVGRAPDQMPSPALARHPRVLATPHIGGLTPEAIEHQALEVVRQVGELVQGRVPPGALNAPQAARLAAFFARAAKP